MVSVCIILHTLLLPNFLFPLNWSIFQPSKVIIMPVTQRYSDGSYYVGEFNNGNPPRWHGRGRIEEANGTYYEGEFQNGCHAGKCEMTDRFGGVYQGNIDYEGSKRMDRPCMHGKGTFKWRDGRLFEGNFNFCCPVEGILTEPNGKKYIVKFDGSTKIEHDPALVGSRMVPTQKILEGSQNIPIPTRNQLEIEARTELEVLEREAIAETEDKKFQIMLQAVKDGA